uniref:coagulation factor Xa n=1 Tax=Gouania willdenowi TaxID=441366 RepID=A0A8C5DUU3_GOUWI
CLLQGKNVILTFTTHSENHNTVSVIYVLARQRRANAFLEEMKQGDMERECIEERCSFEEAKEIFQDMEKTVQKYLFPIAFTSQPCAHDGVCKDGIGTYACQCQTGYEGSNCEIGEIHGQCEYGNGGCEHFCDIVGESVKCYCADGYFLGSDNKSCDSTEPFKCGSIFNMRPIFRNNVNIGNETTSNVTNAEHQNVNDDQPSFTYHNSKFILDEEMVLNGQDCLPGECPWQALLLNEAGLVFCGGTILNKYIILTAAHCVNQSHFIHVKLGEVNTLVNDGNESMHLIETIVVHSHYRAETYHNDIALIKLIQPIQFSRFILPACIPEKSFAEKVLMKQPYGMISGLDSLSTRTSTTLQRLSLPFMDRMTCVESSNLRITTRMFCAGYEHFAKGTCQGDSGGPHVTRYRDTYFITGIVSWGDRCVPNVKYSVFTQVSKYILWIRAAIKVLMPEEMASGGDAQVQSGG